MPTPALADRTRKTRAETALASLVFPRAQGEIIRPNVRANGANARVPASIQQKFDAVRAASNATDALTTTGLARTDAAFQDVGNCQDLAHVACHRLLRNGFSKSELQVLTLDNEPYTHVIAVIVPRTGLLIFCDPWAGIVCFGEEYAAKFRAKMEAWSSNSLTISVLSEGQVDPREFANKVLSMAAARETEIIT